MIRNLIFMSRNLGITQSEVRAPLRKLFCRIVGGANIRVLKKLISELGDPLPIPTLTEVNDISVVFAENVATVYVHIKLTVLSDARRMPDKLEDLVDLRIVCGITEKQQSEMRDLLTGDLPNRIICSWNSYDDKIVTHLRSPPEDRDQPNELPHTEH